MLAAARGSPTRATAGSSPTTRPQTTSGRASTCQRLPVRANCPKTSFSTPPIVPYGRYGTGLWSGFWVGPPVDSDGRAFQIKAQMRRSTATTRPRMLASSPRIGV